MENLNAEQVINELDCQTRFAKFSNSNGVLISVKCAQFVLDHVQYYEQRIGELEAENERLKAHIKEGSELAKQIPEMLALTRADTVRKMQERVEKAICDNTYPDFNKEGKPVNVWKATTGYDAIDQIAKEMLEGEDER